MAKTIPTQQGLAPLAQLLNKHGDAIQAQAMQQTQYTLDADGNCCVMFGPDLSTYPINSFASNPSMAQTLDSASHPITGPGFAYRLGSPGSYYFVKLNT